MSWTVRTLTPQQHQAYIATLPSASFLQCPAWGSVKINWQAESLGWFTPQEQLRGCALVLYRAIPHLGYRLAYLPEGPLIDWNSKDLQAWLDPLVAYLKARKTFAIRMGPPVISKIWSASTIKENLAAHGGNPQAHLGHILADEQPVSAVTLGHTLRTLGWQAPGSDDSGINAFSAGQPRYIFQLPLTRPTGELKTEEELLAGFNQQWRRNIRKADKSGVTVEKRALGALPAFHQLYSLTAQRDNFTPRPLAYFQRMASFLSTENPRRFGLFLATRKDQPLACAIMLQVGSHSWYAYGASDHQGNQWRPSNALQWHMMRQALHSGASTYDMRGITGTLNTEHPLYGLLQFKLGTGGQAVEYLGEWDLPLNKLLYSSFTSFMNARRRRRNDTTTHETAGVSP